MSVFHNFSRFIKNTNQRNATVRKNIIMSVPLRIIGILASLLIVPVTVDYLNNEVYGIWLTLASILNWFSYLDIGLGNGLRNYLTESISRKNQLMAKSYLSTALIAIASIAIVIGFCCIPLLSFVNFNAFFNSQSIDNQTLYFATLIAVCFTLVNFVVKNIGLVFVALQKYAVNESLIVLGNVVALIVIYILTKTTNSNLIYIVTAFTITPVIIFVLATIPIVSKYPFLRPSFKAFDKTLLKQIVGKGLSFFFIQITSILVIYGSSNFFITQICGASAVTTYNIAYKYFSLLVIAYSVIISPMWNAYTDAYVKNDMQWINNTLNTALRLWGISVLVGIIMLFMSNIFYKIWIQDRVEVPFNVSLAVLTYISLFNFNNCVTFLLNGLNKIKVQLYTSVFFTLVYIISIIFLRKHFYITGVVYTMSVCYLGMGLIHLYQCKLIVNKKAKGIWNQ